MKSTPLYHQIYEALLEQIESGEYSPGDRLPSERELSEKLNVNRMTLRQALGLLEEQGLLERKIGAGTFVSEPKVERVADGLFQFTKHLRYRGLETGARVVFQEQRPARASIANRLGIVEGDMIYYGRRLRLLGTTPVMLEKYYLPVAIYPGFERFDLSTRSIYDIILTEYGIQVSYAQLTYEAAIADDYEAELLGISKGAALMLETRIAFDAAGKPVELGRDLYRGDRFKFTVNRAPAMKE